MFGALLAFLAVLVGGLPMLLTAVREARTHRPRDVRRLAVLPCSLLLLGACDAFEEVRRRAHIVLPLHLGTVLDLLFHLLFFLAAGMCAISIGRLVGRTRLTGRLLRFALVPAALATLGMGITIGATVAWFILTRANAPTLFSSPALTMAGFVGLVVVMLVSTLLVGKAVIRGFLLRAVVS